MATVVLWVWCLTIWVLLTTTVTVETLAFGAGVATVATVGLRRLAPFPRSGPVGWRPGMLRLAVELPGRVVAANVRLARIAWSRHARPPSGVVVVPTRADTPELVGAVGLLTSLVVDNQVIDVDLEHRRLLYHCIEVPEPGTEVAHINGPVEQRLIP